MSGLRELGYIRPVEDTSSALSTYTPPVQELAEQATKTDVYKTMYPGQDIRHGVDSTMTSLSAGNLLTRADDELLAGNQANANTLRRQADLLSMQAAEQSGRVTGIEDVKNASDFAAYAKHGIGTLIPTAGTAATAGIGGAAAGFVVGGPVGATVGGAAAGAASVYAMERDSFSQEMYNDPFIRENSTPEDRIKWRQIYGAASASTEGLVPGGVFAAKLMRPIMGKLVRKKALDKVKDEIKKSIAKRAGTVVAASQGEGFTELLQATESQYALDQLNPNRDRSHDRMERVNSYLIGMLGGGVMIAPGEVLGAGLDKAKGKRKALDDEAANAPALPSGTIIDGQAAVAEEDINGEGPGGSPAMVADDEIKPTKMEAIFEDAGIAPESFIEEEQVDLEDQRIGEKQVLKPRVAEGVEKEDRPIVDTEQAIAATHKSLIKEGTLTEETAGNTITEKVGDFILGQGGSVKEKIARLSEQRDAYVRYIDRILAKKGTTDSVRARHQADRAHLMNSGEKLNELKDTLNKYVHVIREDTGATLTPAEKRAAGKQVRSVTGQTDREARIRNEGIRFIDKSGKAVIYARKSIMELGRKETPNLKDKEAFLAGLSALSTQDENLARIEHGRNKNTFITFDNSQTNAEQIKMLDALMREETKEAKEIAPKKTFTQNETAANAADNDSPGLTNQPDTLSAREEDPLNAVRQKEVQLQEEHGRTKNALKGMESARQAMKRNGENTAEIDASIEDLQVKIASYPARREALNQQAKAAIRYSEERAPGQRKGTPVEDRSKRHLPTNKEGKIEKGTPLTEAERRKAQGSKKEKTAINPKEVVSSIKEEIKELTSKINASVHSRAARARRVKVYEGTVEKPIVRNQTTAEYTAELERKRADAQGRLKKIEDAAKAPEPLSTKEQEAQIDKQIKGIRALQKESINQKKARIAEQEATVSVEKYNEHLAKALNNLIKKKQQLKPKKVLKQKRSGKEKAEQRKRAAKIAEQKKKTYEEVQAQIDSTKKTINVLTKAIAENLQQRVSRATKRGMSVMQYTTKLKSTLAENEAALQLLETQLKNKKPGKGTQSSPGHRTTSTTEQTTKFDLDAKPKKGETREQFLDRAVPGAKAAGFLGEMAIRMSEVTAQERAMLEAVTILDVAYDAAQQKSPTKAVNEYTIRVYNNLVENMLYRQDQIGNITSPRNRFGHKRTEADLQKSAKRVETLKNEVAELKQEIALLEKEHPGVKAAAKEAHVSKPNSTFGQREQERPARRINKDFSEGLKGKSDTVLKRMLKVKQGKIKNELFKEDAELEGIVKSEIIAIQQELESRKDTKSTKVEPLNGVEGLAKGMQEQKVKIVFNEKTQEWELQDNEGNAIPLTPEQKKSLNSRVIENHNFKSVEEALADPVIASRRKKVEAYLVKVLGESNFEAILGRLLPEGGALATFEGATRLIRVALDVKDPLSLAFHESFHDLVQQLQHDEVGIKLYRRLIKLAQSPIIQRQMRKMLAGQEAALEQLKDPEEAVVYMYQFWAASKAENGGPVFNISTPAENLFQKLAKLIRSVFGFISKQEQAEKIFEAFYDGKVSESLNPLADFQHQGVAKFMQDNAKPIGKALTRMFITPSDRLKALGYQPLADIADGFFREVRTRGKQGVIQRTSQKNGQFKNKFYAILADVKEEDMPGIVANLRKEVEYDPDTVEGKIQKLFREMYAYVSTGENPVHRPVLQPDGNYTWEPIPELPFFFPRRWDPDKVLQDLDSGKLKRLLLHESKGKISEKEFENFEAAMRASAGQNVQKALENHIPSMVSADARGFGFIDSSNIDKFNEYMENDLDKVVSGYIRDITHRREKTRTFGSKVEKITQLLTKAKRQGADAATIEDAEMAIAAFEGTLGTDGFMATPAAKLMVQSTITMVNIAILPLALFSSLPDPVGVLVRTGSLEQAGKTFSRGVKQIYLDLKKKDPDAAQKVTEYLGIIEAHQALAATGDAYNGQYISEGLKKINDKFFKIIGLDQFTKGTRIQATVASMLWLRDEAAKAKNGDKKAIENLKDLDLTYDDVQMYKDKDGNDTEFIEHRISKLDGDVETARRLQSAIYRMVDEAILRPSSGTRPVWMSDIRMALPGHLKSFTFTFHNSIVKQVLRNFKETASSEETKAEAWLKIAPMLWYVPTMFAATMLRTIVAGRYDDYDDDRLGPAMYDMTQRAAIFGNGTFLMDLADDIKYSGLPVNTFLGPAAGSAYKIGRSAIDPDLDFTKQLMRLAPFSALYRGYFE